MTIGRDCFYPENLPKKSWFEYYASQFSAVEVNVTFYRTFKDQIYEDYEPANAIKILELFNEP